MTPPAAASTAAGRHGRTLRRSPAGRTPRRVSGPAARKTGPAPRKARSPRAVSPNQLSFGAEQALAPALPRTRPAPRRAPVPLAHRVAGLAESRWLDRLLRGRLWIGLIAIGLIGLVFLQVSLLRVNAAMGADVERIDELTTKNAALNADINGKSSLDRVQAMANTLGLTLPPSGTVTFLGHDGESVGGDVPPIPTEASATSAVLPSPTGEETAIATPTDPTAPTTADPAATSATTTTAAPAATTTTATPAATTVTPAPATTDPAATAATTATPTTTTTAPPATATPAPTATGGAAPTGVPE